MSVSIKSPKGELIDVNAVADATPEDAFLLLSEEAQHEVETTLGPSTRQELGELIVLLADVVAKSAESYPIARIEVRHTPVDGAENQSTVLVERSGHSVFTRTCPDIISASVDGLQGLWEHVTADQLTSLAKAKVSMSFLECVSRLARAMSSASLSFLKEDKPK